MDLRAGVRADVQTGAHGVMTTSALRPSRLPELDLRTPTSLEELTGSLAAGWRACGGGTDVLIEALQAGEPTHLVSTTGVHELAQLTCDADGISIGGSVVLARLVRSTSFRSGIAAVADGAQTIGSIQLRNQATLVGNLCSASPAADTTELLASVAEAAAGACSPITDHRCSADYRRQLVHVLTLEVIDEAMRRAGRDDNSDPRVQQGKQR